MPHYGSLINRRLPEADPPPDCNAVAAHCQRFPSCVTITGTFVTWQRAIGQAADAQRHGDVVERAELGQQGGGTGRQSPGARCASRPCSAADRRQRAVQLHRCRTSGIEAPSGAERALARTRGAHNGQRLACAHVQVDTLQHSQGALP